MYSFKGIGLAAVQIGILKRVIVVDVSQRSEKKKLNIIRPSNYKIKYSNNNINNVYDPDTFRNQQSKFVKLNISILGKAKI